MKRFLVLFSLALIPAWGWGQRRVVQLRPAPAKAETKETRYARLDQYARQLPETQATTLEKLATSLAAQARSDDDKARLIFAWLTHHIAYDVAYLHGDTTSLYTPEAVLRSRKAICQGYADLFTDLATRMKLEAHTVSGHAYNWLTTGNPLNTTNGHAWNAYRIAGTWHLADATWGAGSMSLGSEEFEPKFKPYWFDLPSSQAIFTHLPDSITWQLLPSPVTIAAFRSWPYVEPVWFQLISSASLIRAFEVAKGAVRNLPTVEVETEAGGVPVQLVQVPLQPELVAGRPVRFVFQAPSSVRLTVDLYNKLVELQPNGVYQQATVIPAGDQLTVRAWHKADSTTIFLLQYQVIPALRPKRLQPGEHRKVPADSVVYLRR
ncbi:MAG: transglutaminase domain-containing protein [Janthinobacterium lividum]